MKKQTVDAGHGEKDMRNSKSVGGKGDLWSSGISHNRFPRVISLHWLHWCMRLRYLSIDSSDGG